MPVLFARAQERIFGPHAMPGHEAMLARGFYFNGTVSKARAALIAKMPTAAHVYLESLPAYEVIAEYEKYELKRARRGGGELKGFAEVIADAGHHKVVVNIVRREAALASVQMKFSVLGKIRGAPGEKFLPLCADAPVPSSV